MDIKNLLEQSRRELQVESETKVKDRIKWAINSLARLEEQEQQDERKLKALREKIVRTKDLIERLSNGDVTAIDQLEVPKKD